ncbi:putative DNA modification/repair radical SAM protein [Candidatus Aerophobetes bacterium]|uniref:Putative DNA modification/repair radical SAM protein n=2 Tax=Aerophobetes bacterium TaxID=2030807 RepID=A0A523TH73_UNCAE|nr:MAG: putative DNA modification/repair radical SAM protein [Candidatus Aerophobetes bacterium]
MTYLIRKPDSFAKLKVLGEVAKFDVCGLPSIFAKKQKKFQRFEFIYPAVGERGRCVRLFKVLQSNACQGNCFYCANRKNRNFPRVTFTPEELSRLFMQYYSRGLVDGLFLSSAIDKSPQKSQESMLKTLQIIRRKYAYKGYAHFKILPGTDESLIREAGRLADRLSINLEVPSERYLTKLSSTKNFSGELLKGLRSIAKLNKEKPLKAGITTQLVVGAAGETDREILNLSSSLYRNYKLWRVYYSAFMPILDTPLENRPPCFPLRELRLYQADFLLRWYGFSPEELLFSREDYLSLEQDPKLAWALKNPDRFPIEVNKADFWELLRVPGIGRISAQRIVEKRAKEKITRLSQLREIGTVVKRARRFITLEGKFYPSSEKIPVDEKDEQFFLWEELFS